MEAGFASEALVVVPFVVEVVFAFEVLVPAALVVALAFEPFAVAALAVLVAAVLGTALVAATLGTFLVAAALVLVLTAGVFVVTVFVLFVDFVFAVVAFPIAADLLAAGLADVFVVPFPPVFGAEFVDGLAAVLGELFFAVVLAAVDLPATRLEVLEDTVVRDRAAASTFLRPAESAADTATQTPASLR